MHHNSQKIKKIFWQKELNLSKSWEKIAKNRKLVKSFFTSATLE